MAQIFPEEIISFANLSPSSKEICMILEQSLSDEWECHASLSGNNIAHFIITSPDLGVLLLYMSNCSLEHLDSFIDDIKLLRQRNIDTVSQQLQKEKQICNEDNNLKFPIGFGLIFTEVSSDYVNNTIAETLPEFVLFSNELRDMLNVPIELEERLYDMMDKSDFDDLNDDELQLIRENFQSIHIALLGKDEDRNKSKSDGVVKKDFDHELWWSTLGYEWQSLFLGHIKKGNIHDWDTRVLRILNLTEIRCVLALTHLSYRINSYVAIATLASLKPLEKLKQLEKLYASNTQISDLEPLRNLKSLEKLSVNNTQVSGLEPLRNMKSLQSLFLNNTQISDLEPLRNLKSLQSLSINNTQISDLEPLRNLKSLQSLFLNNTQINDLEPLRNLKSFTEINLSNTPVRDLKPLKNIKKIEYFYLNNTQVSDLEPLTNMIIAQLYISDTQVSNIEPLSSVKALFVLDLNNTQISDLEPLRNLKSLKRLFLNNTQINDLEPLSGMESLKELSINNTQVSGLEPLRNMKSLEKLSIDNTKISDLEPLRNLKSLEELSLKNTQVSDLEPLSNLASLKKLSIDDKQIIDLESLKKLKIYDLSISDTQVSDLEPLRYLYRLERIDASNTLISDLKPLRNMKSLHYLSINNSQVSNLEPLQYLNLYSLYINNTQVSDLKPLRNMKSLENLSINNAKINDLEPLRNLKSLKELSVNNTQVSDLEPLRNMDIYDLSINNTQVSNLEPLRNMDIYDLSINNTQVSNLEPLKDHKILNKIKAYHLGFENINSFREKYPFVYGHSERQSEHNFRYLFEVKDKYLITGRAGGLLIVGSHLLSTRMLDILELISEKLTPHGVTMVIFRDDNFPQVDGQSEIFAIDSHSIEINLNRHIADVIRIMLEEYNYTVSFRAWYWLQLLGFLGSLFYLSKVGLGASEKETLAIFADEEITKIIRGFGFELLETLAKEGHNLEPPPIEDDPVISGKILEYINLTQEDEDRSKEPWVTRQVQYMNEDTMFEDEDGKKYLTFKSFLRALSKDIDNPAWDTEIAEMLAIEDNKSRAKGLVTQQCKVVEQKSYYENGGLNNTSKYEEIVPDLEIQSSKDDILINENNFQNTSANEVEKDLMDATNNSIIQRYINHLSYMGYECEKKNAEFKGYICTNMHKKDLIIAPIPKSDLCVFRYRFDVREYQDHYEEMDFLKFINRMNEDLLKSKCFFDKKGVIILECIIILDYSKKTFSSFIEILHLDYTTMYDALSKLSFKKSIEDDSQINLF